MAEITKDCENAVAILPANSEALRNSDVHFYFRQESSFYYLTGFDEPDAIAVFRNIAGKKEYILFVRPKDLEKEIWTGFRAGVEGAKSVFKADRAYTIDEFESQFLNLVSGADKVFYSFAKTQNKNGVELLDQKMIRLLDHYRQSLGRTGKPQLPIYDTQMILGEMRIFKSPEEIERMRRVSLITALAHKETMCVTKPGLNERQIEGFIEFQFKNRGADRMGYNSIVASGSNATVLHYVENNRMMKDGELLLIDAGAEMEYYGADITRTFPVSAKFSKEQKEIYSIVLEIQKECVRMARPGATLTSIHQFAVDALTDAMLKLNFLNGDKKQIIQSLQYKKYYPHGTGHLLGMDVHDVGLYQTDGKPRLLEPGMIFTVEPGFYVLAQDNSVPANYRGIGIRIEDDVLITAEGHEVLTKEVPKEVSDLESIIGSKAWPE